MPCGVDIVDDQYFLTSEIVSVDVDQMLDVRGKLVFTSDVSPFSVAAHLDMAETVNSSRLFAKQLREPFPSTDVSVLRTCRDTDNNGISQVNSCQRPRELSCSPTCVNVSAVLEAENHSAGILLLERGSPHEPLWDVAVKGELHHGYHYYRVRQKQQPLH